ncbi:hypothetical protein CANINC_002141 [Pichia inconspicua]|uniref:Uncharacterized protein n=1 Tax=Pichia inconspicua TaxID=52247 RepID=A0A4T0X2H5_9ASCO|nr:hypothetical protein CANINC_002141 [[Candida] inconspicua]
MQQLSQSVSNDLLDIQNLLKTHTNDSEDELLTVPTAITHNEIGHFNIEQDTTVIFSSQGKTNQVLHSRKSTESVKKSLSSTNITPYFELPNSKEESTTLSNSNRSKGDDKIKSRTDTNNTTNTYTNNNMSQHGMNCVGIISGNSSPNSNFSCTPIESVSSCTPEATLTSELNEIYDSLPTMNTMKHSINNDPNDNVQTQIDNKYQMNNIEVDAAEKFFLEQFSIDEELEKIISSPSNPLNQSVENETEKFTSSNISRNSKKRKVSNEPAVDNSSLRKCFSKLKSNYLSLCQTYNRLLDDYNKTKHQNKELRRALDDAITEKEILENEKDYYLVEREDMKAAIESLLHEVTIYRSKSKVRSKCVC